MTRVRNQKVGPTISALRLFGESGLLFDRAHGCCRFASGTPRGLAALAPDPRHVLAILGNRLAALPSDVCHVLLVPRDGQSALAGNFVPSFRVHGRRAAGASLVLLATLFAAFSRMLRWMLLFVLFWKAHAHRFLQRTDRNPSGRSQ